MTKKSDENTAPTVVYYEVETDGIAQPFPKEELEERGHIRPTAECVVTFPSGNRAVFYPKESPNAQPIASLNLQPKAFKTDDAKNLHGEFLPYLLRRALTIVEPWSKKDLLIIICAGAAAVFSFVAMVIAFIVVNG